MANTLASMPSASELMTAAMLKLQPRFGSMKEPRAGAQGFSAYFECAQAKDLRTLFVEAGATVSFVGVIPTMLGSDDAAPLVAGTVEGVPFTARCRPIESDRVRVEIRLTVENMQSGTTALNVSAQFLIVDEVLGGSKITPQIVAGYLTHRLMAVKSKARTRLLAELASVLAEAMHEEV